MKSVLALIIEGRSSVSRRTQRTLTLFVAAQVLLVMFDTAALYLLSTIAVPRGDDGLVSLDTGVAVVGGVVGLFAVRSILSTLSAWHTMKVVSREEVAIGQRNFVAFLSAPRANSSRFELNDLYNVADRAPGALLSGVVLGCYSILAEFLAGLLILAALVVLQPVTSLATTGFFLLVAIIQHRVISRRTDAAGRRVVSETQNVYESLTDAFMLGNVLSVMPSASLPSHLENSRRRLVDARLRASFLATVPRYFMELVLASGLVVVTLASVVSGNEAGIAQSLVVFAAAGFRLLPIVNRIQSLVLSVLATAPTAALTSHPELEVQITASSEPLDAANVIEFENVGFSYPGERVEALSGVTLGLKSGLQYAVIGPSAAGKTTLVQLALGLLKPTAGDVRVSSRCRVGFVPQDAYIARGSVEQNIALEWSDECISVEAVENAIRKSELGSLRRQRVGPASLSGGQRQRVALGRALYRSPNLLFLDEATSALDAETEDLVMQSVHQLRSRVTVVIVAHRLTTVQRADQVIYLDGGVVAGVGRLDELRARLPKLQRQIELGSLDLGD